MTDHDNTLHPLIPGQTIPGDWFPGRVPDNIEVGPGTVIESSHSFRYYRAESACGFRTGRNVTLWRTSLAVERDGLIEIGDNCYLANASLVCVSRVTLGKRVMVAGGVTIVDSDFHPLDPAGRMRDTVELSPIGDKSKRKQPPARPVTVEDDVWIGYNATILKGVRIGRGAVIGPGSVVVRDVPAGATVAGNPAVVQEAEA